MKDHGLPLPTEEEKSIYSEQGIEHGLPLPTEEEKAKLQLEEEKQKLQPEESSTLSDIGTGAAQGLTFGFSDEMIAAAKAIAESATSKEKGLKDLPALYRQYQQLEQEKVRKAKEASPYAFTAAELAGGIAPIFFTGGGAAAARGAAAVAEGAEAAKIASSAVPALIAKETPAAAIAATEAAPSFFPSVLKAAKTGAGYGALTAAGTTETPIEEGSEFGKEIAKGAVAGATLGAGFSALGKASKALMEEAGDTAIIRQAKKTFQEAKAGMPMFGEAAKKAQIEREGKTAEELTSSLMEAKDAAGKQIKAVLESYTEPLQSLSFSKVVNRLSPDLPKPVRDNLFYYSEKLASGEITASELNEVKKIIYETVYKYKDNRAMTPDTIDALNTMGAKAEEILSGIPGYKKANQRFHDILEAAHETITEKGTPIDFRERYFSDISRSKEKLFDEIKGLIRTLGKPGTTADVASDTVLALEKNLKALGEKDPEIFKQLGFSPEKFLNKLKEEADVSAVSQVRRGYEPQAGVVKKFLQLITPSGATYTGAAFAGKAAKAAESLSPSKLASSVYNAAPEQLQKLSQKLLSNPATKHFGENLANALTGPSKISHRAVLFTILQSPDARRAIADMYPGVGEE